MKRIRKILLQNTATGDYWSGQFGWMPSKSKAMPLTDEEAAIRIQLEVGYGAYIEAFKCHVVFLTLRSLEVRDYMVKAVSQKSTADLPQQTAIARLKS